MTCRVQLRNAVPEDAPFIAWAMVTAARSHLSYGLWDHLLNVSYTERLRILQSYACTPVLHAHHYSCFRILEADGRPAATVSAYASDAMSAEADADALIDTLLFHGWSGPRIDELIQRAAVWTTLQVPSSASTWVLESLVTVPAARRLGLAQYLLMDTIAASEGYGFEQTEVRVVIGNEAAENAYEKLGFELASEHVSGSYMSRFNTPGIRRLVRRARPRQRLTEELPFRDEVIQSAPFDERQSRHLAGRARHHSRDGGRGDRPMLGTWPRARDGSRDADVVHAHPRKG